MTVKYKCERLGITTYDQYICLKRKNTNRQPCVDCADELIVLGDDDKQIGAPAPAAPQPQKREDEKMPELKKCKIEGCTEKPNQHGYCKKHWGEKVSKSMKGRRTKMPKAKLDDRKKAQPKTADAEPLPVPAQKQPEERQSQQKQPAADVPSLTIIGAPALAVCAFIDAAKKDPTQRDNYALLIGRQFIDAAQEQ